MGVASSTIEDDKVLVLCQERKRFVREALDGRCALACAHHDYIMSLRDTGSLLRKCFEGEKSLATANEEGHVAESEDSFDNLSTETVAQVHKNPNDLFGHNTLTEQSIAHHASSEDIASANRLKGKRRIIDVITNENDEMPAIPPVNVVPLSAAAHPMDSKAPYPDVKNVVKDLSSCMKEIEILFFKACESGKQVPMILEEDKIQFRPLLPEEIAHGSKASKFLAIFLVCCREEVSIPEPPPQAEIKYLTWHRSVSSQLSPSKNPPGTILDIHTSTLESLYAWETKLYDEVKASNSICRKYDEKCKQLGDQESRGKNQIITDFTRAAVKDLHSRILVAVQKIDFISNNIEDLRDKELQPQLDELIDCFTMMWATMLARDHQVTIQQFFQTKYTIRVRASTPSRPPPHSGAQETTPEPPKLDRIPQGLPAQPEPVAAQVHETSEEEEELQEAKRGRRRRRLADGVCRRAHVRDLRDLDEAAGRSADR